LRRSRKLLDEFQDLRLVVTSSAVVGSSASGSAGSSTRAAADHDALALSPES